MNKVPKPVISDFIISNAKGVQGNDGVYYHFTEVISLLKKYESNILSRISESQQEV